MKLLLPKQRNKRMDILIFIGLAAMPIAEKLKHLGLMERLYRKQLIKNNRRINFGRSNKKNRGWYKI